MASETEYAYITNSDDNSYTRYQVKKDLINTKTCKVVKPQGNGALNKRRAKLVTLSKRSPAGVLSMRVL